MPLDLEVLEWVKLSERAPPYDWPIAVMDKNLNIAVAFNQCYPPSIALTCMNNGEYGDLKIEPVWWFKLPFYP
jgi:hypothetical protein